MDASTARIDLYVFGDEGIAGIRLNTWDTGFNDFDPTNISAAWQVPYHFVLDQMFA